MKKFFVIIIPVIILSLILPQLVLAHGQEEHMAAAPTKKVMDEHMSQPAKQSTDNSAVKKESVKTETGKPGAGLGKIAFVRDSGILALFLLMMAIGFVGFVGYSRRHNV